MKKVYLIGALLSFGLLAEAQSFMRFEDKAFNFGAKVGFNATFPVINSLSINGKEAENIDIEYKVGYRSEGNIRFSIPQSLPENNMLSNTSATTDLLMMKTSSLEVPIMVGYNLVKKGPYGLSLMVGPKLKYNYKIAYTVESSTTHVEYVNDNTPFGVNIATGVGVSIGRLFFDFVYEFGLNQVESDFEKVNNPVPEINYDINIDKRTNVMSISLGVLF